MEPKYKRMTATERESLMRINLGLRFITDEAESLRKRNELVPRGNWILSVTKGLLTRYMKLVYATVPTDQLKTVRRSIMDTTYTVGVRCPATRDIKRDHEYGVVVPIGALNAIFAACGEHCLMCIGNGEEQARCPLRKALDAIPNDVEDRQDGGCPYQGVLINDNSRGGDGE